MPLTHSPKQARSKSTEERLLNALELLLEEAYFDQISIKDIAGKAGVAVGTVYRRFKDKDALLPVLYGRYEQDLQAWVDSMWSEQVLQQCSDAEARLHHLVTAHVEFYSTHRGMMRTLHLYARLGGDLADSRHGSERKSQYLALLQPVIELLPAPLSANQLRMVILVLVSSLSERLFYPDINPSRQLALSQSVLISEMTDMLAVYMGR